MSDSSEKDKLERAFAAAMDEAARREKAGGKDISFGAVRLRTGLSQKHDRWIGDAKVTVTYRGVNKEPGGVLRPMYRVLIAVRGLRHKLTVGAPASWHETSGTPVSPDAIDAAAGGAVRFASTPDEDTDEEVAAVIDEATQSALKENGEYEIRRAP
jgi:hypothetical protein